MAFGDFSSIVSEVGGAVSDLFGSKGLSAEANSYTGAAALANQNAQLTTASTRIQEVQTARQVSQSLGTTQADVSGAGFTESGSALDLMAMSAQQGALAKSLVNIQGAINENAYAAQAGALAGQAAAAKGASSAANIGGLVNAAGAAIGAIGGILNASGTSIAGVGSALYNSIFGTTDSAAAAAGVDQSAAVWVNAAGDSVAANTPGAIQLTADQASQLAETGIMPSDAFSAVDETIQTTADTGSSLFSDIGSGLSDIGNSIGDFFSSLF